MTITKTQLKVLDAEVTCIVGVVESGVGHMFYGTTGGDIKKYNIATGVITTLQNVGEKVLSIDSYSGILYIGLAGGKFVSLSMS